MCHGVSALRTHSWVMRSGPDCSNTNKVAETVPRKTVRSDPLTEAMEDRKEVGGQGRGREGRRGAPGAGFAQATCTGSPGTFLIRWGWGQGGRSPSTLK